VRGAWCVVRGAWCVVRGAWCVVRGAWCDQCLKLPLAILSLHFVKLSYNGRNFGSLGLF